MLNYRPPSLRYGADFPGMSLTQFLNSLNITSTTLSSATHVLFQIKELVLGMANCSSNMRNIHDYISSASLSRFSPVRCQREFVDGVYKPAGRSVLKRTERRSQSWEKERKIFIDLTQRTD